MAQVLVDVGALSPEDVVSVAREGAGVALSPAAQQKRSSAR
ncbi:hypothetical protein ACIBK8_34730 [Streptomyces sp. NPDC050161]